MTEARFTMNRVHCMDCIEFLEGIPDNTIDSCVTDPPYGLEFMGKDWDAPWKFGFSNIGYSDGAKRKPFPSFSSSRNKICLKCGFRQRGEPKRPACSCEKPEWDESSADDMRKYQAWCEEWAREVLRVLKPGSHILAFSGTRTYHRLACAVEDAGFEIRDQIHWLYGSGFPKGLNVSFGIMQKQLYEWLEDYPKKREKLRSLKGTERRQYMIELMVEADIAEVLDRAPLPWNERKQWTDFRGGRFHRADGEHKHTSYQHIMPKTPEAKEWYGFNTQLKPAIEPIVLARKPISEKSIVENVLIHGTGAINIDACRIAVNPDVDDIGERYTKRNVKATVFRNYPPEEIAITGVLPAGRYPANLILSHHPDCKLIQEGVTKVKDVSTHAPSQKMGKHGIYGDYEVPMNMRHSFDVAKPEVWRCVVGCPIRILNEQSGDTSRTSPRGVRSYDRSRPRLGAHGIYGSDEPTDAHIQEYGDKGGSARFFYCAKPSAAERNAGIRDKRNVHITVKPLEIMRWLVRLVTRRGGVVLDPFLGSGTTAIAAENEGCNWFGCDNNESYCKIAEARIKALGGTQTRIINFQDDGRESESMKNEGEEGER